MSRLYTYRGDKMTAPHLKGATCFAELNSKGKCIRGANGSMLVEFVSHGRQVVLARQLRRIK